jgi:hypothetical protein
MNGFRLKSLTLALPIFLALSVTAPAQQSASMAESEPDALNTSAPGAAPIGGHVYAFPVSTRSAEAANWSNSLSNSTRTYCWTIPSTAPEKPPKKTRTLRWRTQYGLSLRAEPTKSRRPAQSGTLRLSAPADERLLVKFLTNVQKQDRCRNHFIK